MPVNIIAVLLWAISILIKILKPKPNWLQQLLCLKDCYSLKYTKLNYSFVIIKCIQIMFVLNFDSLSSSTLLSAMSGATSTVLVTGEDMHASLIARFTFYRIIHIN